VWGDAWFLALDDRSKLLWLHLLTTPRSSAFPGLIRSGAAGIAEDLRWKARDVDDRLRAFCASNGHEAHAMRDPEALVIWLPRAVEFNPPRNPNAVTAWARAIHDVPECGLRAEAFASAGEFVAALPVDREKLGIKRKFLELFRRWLPEPLVQRLHQQLTQSFGEPFPEPLPEPLVQYRAGAGAEDQKQEQASLNTRDVPREDAQPAAPFSGDKNSLGPEEKRQEHERGRVDDLLAACERFFPQGDWESRGARKWAADQVRAFPLVNHAHEAELAARKARKDKRPIEKPQLFLPRWFERVQADREKERARTGDAR
jgi:hypothetical protein